MLTLGRACLILALATSLYGIAASLYGARTRQRAWVDSGRRAVYAMAGIAAVAFGVLEAHAPQAPLSDEELAQIISAMAGDDAEGIAGRVAGTLRRNGGEPRDDVAILVLQVARG